MVNIFLVYVYENEVSGFRTYRESFYQCIKLNGFKCHDIILDHPTSDFIIEETNSVKYYKIPECNSLKAIGTLLSLYIDDRKTNIFFQQFSRSYPVISMLKEFFPMSKLVYVIHDFIWASKLFGNIEMFKNIINANNQNEDSEHNYEIIDLYEDGKKTFNLVDKVVCLSTDTKQLLQEVYKINDTKLALIPNGLKDEAGIYKKNASLRARYNISKNDKIFLFVGRLTEQKGTFIIFEAINRIIKEHQNIRFVFAGIDYGYILNQIPEQIKQYIILLGCITKEKLYEWYNESDYGIIPTYYEQCSYVGIEMKMFGLPVVSSNGFGINSMFNNDNCLKFELWNKHIRPSVSLAETILRLFTLKQNKIEILKNNSREDYLHSYSAEKMMHSYKLLINSIAR